MFSVCRRVGVIPQLRADERPWAFVAFWLRHARRGHLAPVGSLGFRHQHAWGGVAVTAFSAVGRADVVDALAANPVNREPGTEGSHRRLWPTRQCDARIQRSIGDV